MSHPVKFHLRKEAREPLEWVNAPLWGVCRLRETHTATLLKDGTVLVTGGVNQSGILATAELYQ
jgi:hypothetical protein